MKNEGIELDVLVNERPVKTYGHQGRTYIEAKDGTEYKLRIRNNNNYRVLAVVSVDGIDVISGKEASYDGGGYIVSAYSSIEIKGYRKDLTEVGAFKFTKKKKSYAKAVTGSGKNTGVISIATFKEKQVAPQPVPQYVHNYHHVYWGTPPKQPAPVWPQDTWYCTTTDWNEPKHHGSVVNCSASINDSFTRSSSKGAMARGATAGSYKMSAGRGQAMNCSLNASDTYAGARTLSAAPEAPRFEAGSGWGTKIQDQVREVTFERESTIPLTVLEIFYDFRDNLKEIGIDLDKNPKVSFPLGFNNKFANPPVGWNG